MPSIRKVTVIIATSPYASARAEEALRMCVGLTLCDDDIRVVFRDDAVYVLKTQDSPENAMGKHIHTLIQLKKKLFAHDESIAERKILNPGFPVETKTTEDIARMVTESDVVISWPS